MLGRNEWSFMSISVEFILPRRNQSNEWTNNAKINGTCIVAKDCPGQILFPALKGIYSKLFPLECKLESRNRSSLKHNESFQIMVSRPIAHMLTKTWESSGTV